MKKYDAKEIKNLQDTIDLHLKQLQPFREKQKSRLEQYVGYNYSNDGTKKHVPLNLLHQAITIYIRRIAAKNPSVIVETDIPSLKSRAKDFQQVLKKTIKEMHFDNTLRKSILMALLGLGCVKLGLNKSRSVEIGGIWHDVGEPSADVVLLDDLVYDTNATSFETMQFIGDKIRMPLADLRRCGLFDEKAVDKMAPDEKTDHNSQGDDKVSSLSGDKSHTEDFIPMVELWQIYFPPTNRIIVIPVENKDVLLRDEQWTGPENGPYYFLRFIDIPGNIMPMAPSAIWEDIHHIVNELFRKSKGQADDQKNLMFVGSGNKEDAKTIRESKDGDTLVVDDPSKVNGVNFGGPDQKNLAFMIWLEQENSKQCGNLDSLGGLGPQAETLGQDQMISQNASVQAADMQDRVEEFAGDLIEGIGYLKWYDPIVDTPYTKSIPGTDLELSERWTPDCCEGDFLEYNFTLIPYSMRHQTPEGQVQKMMQVLNQLNPYLAAMQQQGLVFSFEELVKFISEYADLPQLKDILQSMNPDESITQDTPGQANSTQHNYTRRSIPGATNAGKADVMARLLSGGGAQDGEAASLMNPVG